MVVMHGGKSGLVQQKHAAHSEHRKFGSSAVAAALDPASGQAGARAVGVPERRHSAWRRRCVDPAWRARRAARIRPRLRFAYVTDRDEDQTTARYHLALATVEELFDRVLAARMIGMRAIHAGLPLDAEQRLQVQPRRGSFSTLTPEYVRWFGRNGIPRTVPMVREELALEWMAEFGYSYEQSLKQAAHSAALSRVDQQWLLGRASTPPACRPLHGAEWQRLVHALNVVYVLPPGANHRVVGNRQRAARMAAMLGLIVDSTLSSPFRHAGLNQAFDQQRKDGLPRALAPTRWHSLVPLPHGLVLGWFFVKKARLRSDLRSRIGIA